MNRILKKVLPYFLYYLSRQLILYYKQIAVNIKIHTIKEILMISFSLNSLIVILRPWQLKSDERKKSSWDFNVSNLEYPILFKQAAIMYFLCANYFKFCQIILPNNQKVTKINFARNIWFPKYAYAPGRLSFRTTLSIQVQKQKILYGPKIS